MSPKRNLNLLLATFLLAALPFSIQCASAAPLNGQSPQAGAKTVGAEAKLSLETQRIVVFKNGLALFVKKAKGTADEKGRLFTEELPERAVLGTFWTLSKDLHSTNVESFENINEKTTPSVASSMTELLQANQGKKVQLTLQQGEKRREIDATILKVLAKKNNPEDFKDLGYDWDFPEYEAGAQFVLIETKRQEIIPIYEVSAISSDSLNTEFDNRSYQLKTQKRLIFDFGPDAANSEVEFSLLYFQHGLHWTPTYHIDSIDKDTAQLTLQAELVNEAEAINDVPIELAVGVPNFRFADDSSVVSMQQAIGYYASSQYDNAMQVSNAIYTQQAYAPAEPGYDSPNGQLADAQNSQDIFIYPAGKNSLSKNGSALIPLWTEKVDKRELFTLDIVPTRSVDGYGSYNNSYGSSPSPLQLNDEKIWRQFELHNESNKPWTTGAALLFGEGNLPLAQELLTYTPPKSKVQIPVTVAVDLRGDFEEKETDRETNALKVNDQEFTKISKEGKIHLTNFSSDEAHIQVKLKIGGKVTSASDKGKIRVLDYNSGDWYGAVPRVNNHSEVIWEIDLDAGSSTTLEVESHYFSY